MMAEGRSETNELDTVAERYFCLKSGAGGAIDDCFSVKNTLEPIEKWPKILEIYVSPRNR
jgi:hypothetical protein